MENKPFKFETPNKPTKLKIYCPFCSKDNGRIRFNFGLKPSIIMKCKFCEQEFALSGIGLDNKAREPMLMMFGRDKNFSFFCPFDGKKDFEDVLISDRVHDEVGKQCKNCPRNFMIRYFDSGNKEDSMYWANWKEDQKLYNWNS